MRNCASDEARTSRFISFFCISFYFFFLSLYLSEQKINLFNLSLTFQAMYELTEEQKIYKSDTAFNRIRNRQWCDTYNDNNLHIHVITWTSLRSLFHFCGPLPLSLPFVFDSYLVFSLFSTLVRILATCLPSQWPRGISTANILYSYVLCVILWSIEMLAIKCCCSSRVTQAVFGRHREQVERKTKLFVVATYLALMGI